MMILTHFGFRVLSVNINITLLLKITVYIFFESKIKKLKSSVDSRQHFASKS